MALKLIFNPFTSSFDWIDTLSTVIVEWQDSVLDKDLTAPPASPNVGDRYLIGTDPTPSGYLTGTITDISVSSPTVITSNSHGLTTGDWILIQGTNSNPVIDGYYQITKISDDTFSIPIAVIGAGNTGNWKHGIATDAWTGHDGDIAEYSSGGWSFTSPSRSMVVICDDEDTLCYLFDGTDWVPRDFEKTTASTGLMVVGRDVRVKFEASNPTLHIVGSDELAVKYSTGFGQGPSGLTSDLHTGKAGGQTIYGGTLANESLTIQPNIADATTGQINISGSLDASSTSVAALTIAGGLGVAKKSFFGDEVTVNNAATIESNLTLGKNGLLSPSEGTIILCDGNNPGSTETLTYTKWNSLNDTNGIVKCDGSGNFSAAIAGTDYEVPLTFASGLTRTLNTITNDFVTGKNQAVSTLVGGTLTTQSLTIQPNIADTTSGTLLLNGAETQIREILKINGTTSGSVGFKAQATAGSVIYTLPSSDSTGTQALTSDGSANLGWSSFEPPLTKGNLTESTSNVLTIINGTNAVIGTGTSIQVKKSDYFQNGYLSNSDFIDFYNRERALTHNILFPKPIEFNGSTYNVNDESSLLAAISSASNGDIINLTADITLTSTLNINKTLKFTGNYSLQSAGTSSDPATLINVTGNNVYFTSDITIKHLKTTNSGVERAVSVNANGFISESNVEFMEIGYALKGSWSISGTTTYTGASGNNHYHIIIYKVDNPSEINGVTFDFPSEATPRSRFVYITSGTSSDKINSYVRIANNMQYDTSKILRQFFLQDAWQKDSVTNALIINNNVFNDSNGGIGLYDASGSVNPLSFYSFIEVRDNYQLDAGISSYKGLLYLDGTGSLRSIGNTTLYYSGNRHPTNLRSDYTSAIDYGGVAYNNTIFTNPTPLSIQENIKDEHNIYNSVKNLITRTTLNYELNLKANTSLNNLNSVAINTSLISDTDNNDDLGSISLTWRDLYLSGGVKLKSNVNKLTTISPNPSAAASVNYILPINDGSANDVLSTNGSGSLSWLKVLTASTGDINEKSFSGANNQSSPADVTNFVFSNTYVRSFKALVSVIVDATTKLYEVFEIIGVQKESGWDIAISSTGDDSLVSFSITSSGQIQYTSGNYSGFNSLTIKFRAYTTSV